MLMKRRYLLFAAALSFCLGTQAQYVDVTAQYIPNAGFEECDALPIIVRHDNLKNVDVNVVELYSDWSVAKGEDYAAQGWKLAEQLTNANGGVVTYGCNIQSGKYATAGEPGPTAGITGSKGLCFCGNNGLVYQQVNEITLPAGSYRLTVNLYARNGQTTNPGPTQQVVNVKTGFMPTGGTENDLIPLKRESMQFASNAWDQEVIEIELTQPTAGRFQISYGTSYFAVVDDVKLEYLGGVVTTALQTVITKAQTLNTLLEDATLATAIGAAQDFVSNPTSQEDVDTQVEALYTAMGNALTATSRVPVNITAAYVDNASFETGKIDPWTWGSKTGSVTEPINEDSQPYIDGAKVVEFAQSGSNSLTQTISHLPAGYYAVDVRLNQKATVILGSNETACQGGVDYLYLNVHPTILNFAGGDLTIGIKGTAAYRCDLFRLFYGKDEASLLTTLLQTVKANALSILNKTQFANITGEERTELLTALNGTDIEAINTAVNNFVASKDAYDSWVKAKSAAAPYTMANYPYAKRETLEQIQALLNTEATSRSIAQEYATALTNACTNALWENAYCEGVSNTDYTDKVVAANAGNASSVNAAWTTNNIGIRKLSSYKALLDRQGTKDLYVYGTTEAYVSASSSSASIQQAISGLPAGTYVVAVSMMAKSGLTIDLRANGTKIGTFTGTGTAASNGWAEVVCTFEKSDATTLTLRVDEAVSSSNKEWYVDNFRLYQLSGQGDSESDGISTIRQAVLSDQHCYNLNGQRVAQPAKGLYIVNGHKVIIR